MVTSVAGWAILARRQRGLLRPINDGPTDAGQHGCSRQAALPRSSIGDTVKLIDICKRPVVSIDHAAPLRDAARLMRRHHVGALVVTRQGDHGTELLGMVTDRDLAIEALARDFDAAVVAVGSIASDSLVGVPAEAGLDEAVLRMRTAGVRRLIVYTVEGELAGIVSFDDLIDACATLLADLTGVLREGYRREARSRAVMSAPPPLRIPAIGTMGWHLGHRITT
jgi:CBS domain-containing protein